MRGRYHPNAHHRRSERMPRFDYSQNAFYYITICCWQKECFFGDIANGLMLLNNLGSAAEECWLEIPKHFPDSVLHAHVVMPNHMHGIIEIQTPVVEGQGGVRAQDFEPLRKSGAYEPGSEGFPPLPEQPPCPGRRHKFQKTIPRSIGSIIRGYKVGVTKWVRNNTDIHTIWQRNYYEHVIRDENAYKAITEYIHNNPAKWKDDRFHS
jgi:putative transposase